MAKQKYQVACLKGHRFMISRSQGVRFFGADIMKDIDAGMLSRSPVAPESACAKCQELKSLRQEILTTHRNAPS